MLEPAETPGPDPTGNAMQVDENSGPSPETESSPKPTSRPPRFRLLKFGLPLVVGLALAAGYTSRHQPADTEALMIRAWRYANGEGLPQDDAKAAELFLKAAEHGHPLAMYEIGCYYHLGRGVEQDYLEAAKWWRRAARHGDREAMNNLGVLREQGDGVEKDLVEAFLWYRSAAELGHVDATYMVGAMHANAVGVARDYEAAYAWLQVAADLGHAEAQAGLANLERLLSPEAKDRAIEKAKQLASEIVQTPSRP